MPQRTEAMLDLRFESEERNKKEGSRAAAKFAEAAEAAEVADGEYVRLRITPALQSVSASGAPRQSPQRHRLQ